MTVDVGFGEGSALNPLDLLEDVMGANSWPFDRTGPDELVGEVSGHWCDYRLLFAWADDLMAMQFTCAMDMKVPIERRAEIRELLTLINDRLWLGHFNLCSDDAIPVFRHTVLLRGGTGASSEQLEDLVDIAVVECERYYPAFQLVIWGGRRPADALLSVMLEPEGTA